MPSRGQSELQESYGLQSEDGEGEEDHWLQQ